MASACMPVCAWLTEAYRSAFAVAAFCPRVLRSSRLYLNIFESVLEDLIN